MERYQLAEDLRTAQLPDGRYSVFVGAGKKSYVMEETEFRLMCTMGSCQDAVLLSRRCNKYSPTEIEALMKTFVRLGILREGKEKQRRLKRTGVLKYQLPLFSGDGIFPAGARWVRLLSFILLWLSVPLLAAGLVVFRRTTGRFLPDLAVLAECPLWGYLVLFFFLVLLHELGHAVVTRALGIPVPEIGILVYLFCPVAYTNISFSRLLVRRRDRMKCLLAGVLTNVLLAGLSLLLSGVWEQARAILTVNAILNLLIVITNLNVFFKLDGYFILQDLLEIPALYEQSLQSFVSLVTGPVVRRVSRRKKQTEISRFTCGTRYRTAQGGLYPLYGGLCLLYLPLMLVSCGLTVLSLI